MNLRRALRQGAVALAIVCALFALTLGGLPLPPLHAAALADPGNGNGKGQGNGAGSDHASGNNGNGNGNGNGAGNGNGNGAGNGNGNGAGNGNGNGQGNGNGAGNGNGNGQGNGNGNGQGNGNGNAYGKNTDDADGTAADDASGSAVGGTGTASGAPVQSEGVAGQGHDRAVRHEVVVAENSARLAAFARAKGFRVVGTEKLGALGIDVTRLQAPEGVGAAEAKAMLSAAFPQAVVDFNHLYQPQTSLSLPAVDYPTKAVHWVPALQTCGAAVKLGLIDTAVVWSVPILKGAQRKAAGFVDQDTRPAPPQHGTGIATLLVGQRGFGLMPSAALYSASIFGLDADQHPVASATSFVAALNWLAANNVETINVSLSGPPDRLMELAVARAQQLGLRLVAAVGNDGTNGVPRYPAAYPGVVGVTAVDQDGRALAAGNRGSFVALAAPGVDIWIPGQPGSGAAPMDRLETGTSFAAPYVTAALAAFGNNVDGMLAAALDLGAPGVDPVYGHGLVQAPTACASRSASR